MSAARPRARGKPPDNAPPPRLGTGTDSNDSFQLVAGDDGTPQRRGRDPDADRRSRRKGSADSNFDQLDHDLDGTDDITPPGYATRFWSRVDVRGPGECWPWMGGLSGGRYGKLTLDGRLVGAHRVAVMLATNKPIPAGLVVHHICRVTQCVNPAHLRVDTQGANVLRDDSPPSTNARKRDCIAGHPFAGTNLRLYVRPSGEVERVCRTCEAVRRQAKRRAA